MTGCRARGCNRRPKAQGLCASHYAQAARLGLLEPAGPCGRCQRQLAALSTSVHVPHDHAAWWSTCTESERAAWSKGYLDAIAHRYDTGPIDQLLAGLRTT